MKSKRITNTTGIKVQFLGATNNRGARIKIVQMNSKKSVYINPSNLELINQVCEVLDSVELIESYNILIDNTQDNYYIFNINFNGYSFEDITQYFKK
jgi:ABC-type transporter lipoprotein component MlaA